MASLESPNPGVSPLQWVSWISSHGVPSTFASVCWLLGYIGFVSTCWCLEIRRSSTTWHVWKPCFLMGETIRSTGAGFLSSTVVSIIFEWKVVSKKFQEQITMNQFIFRVFFFTTLSKEFQWATKWVFFFMLESRGPPQAPCYMRKSTLKIDS